ncbi:Cell division topological specificity factor MinE [Candidatus Syntrophocurvum alkaliphilum]|uniref:Cell division topological specificity factor n=1 Tax=Candidatus Syntrophocurvum alkaliphilum TaxID=2293317 RepID=A0A6I6DGP9_9FIRM|nr:cell division topological specificity factor MinE [Candidatus Syntrophocurvum alkaliphilum]QGU00043.1 Cell division topological specificity factor MinE [Candidatus Syntrophocurvum alkaliphilum]
MFLDVLNKFFGKESAGSKELAKERLRLVLVHDRASVTPEFFNQMKEDIIKVIREYMDIDDDAISVDLSNEDNSIALVANIPVKGFKRAVNQ